MGQTRWAEFHLNVTLRSPFSVDEPLRCTVVLDEAEGKLGTDRLATLCTFVNGFKIVCRVT